MSGNKMTQSVLEKLYIPYQCQTKYYFSFHHQRLMHASQNNVSLSKTGWIWNSDVTLVSSEPDQYRIWLLNGKRSTPMEVFESLTPKQQAKAIFELDEWK